MDTFAARKKDICPFCRVEVDNREAHIKTDIHRYNVIVHYNAVNLRENAYYGAGCRLGVHSINYPRSTFYYNDVEATYYLYVAQDQVFTTFPYFSFRCSFFNVTQDMIKITHGGILGGPAVMLDNVNSNWLNTGARVCICPGFSYTNIMIRLDLVDPIIGRYSIPFAFNLEINGVNVHVSRKIVVVITGNSIDERRPPMVRRKYRPMHTPKVRYGWESEFAKKPTKERTSYNEYKIKEDIVEYMKAKEDSKETSPEAEKVGQVMNTGLTMENYKNYFHNCLWMEEKQATKESEKLSLYDVRSEVTPEGNLVIPLANQGGRRACLGAGNLIRVRQADTKQVFEGYILRTGRGIVEVHKINRSFMNSLEGTKKRLIDVQFVKGRIPMERMHKCLDIVVAKNLVKFLFPDQLSLGGFELKYRLTDNDFMNQKLASDPNQRTAVENILNCSSQGAPYIVFGPTGSGKSDTIVEAIVQILRQTKKKILVCAPANAHCDSLAIKLAKYCLPNELSRAYSNCRNVCWIPGALKQYVNVTDRYITRISGDYLNEYRVVVTTLIFIGKFHESQYSPDYVFIDEAAQAQEPEVCVALSRMRKGGSLVLSGDPKQLRPLVKSGHAKKFGLDTSLLQRLIETQKIYQNEDARYITTLKKNYRCHPMIMDVSNELFYENKLESATETTCSDPISNIDLYSTMTNDDEKADPSPGSPIEFCAVLSEEKRGGLSPSYSNYDEISMIMNYLRVLLKKIKITPRISRYDIGIISPYSKQVMKIRSSLRFHEWEDIDVGTVESFQGREKRVIIVSTVRSQCDHLKYDNAYALGFLKQAERFNVAITRGVSKVVVIGCPVLLSTDANWNAFIKKCQELGTYHGMIPEVRDYAERVNTFRAFPRLRQAMENSDGQDDKKEDSSSDSEEFKKEKRTSTSSSSSSDGFEMIDSMSSDFEMIGSDLSDSDDPETSTEKMEEEDLEKEDLRDVIVGEETVDRTGVQKILYFDTTDTETESEDGEYPAPMLLQDDADYLDSDDDAEPTLTDDDDQSALSDDDADLSLSDDAVSPSSDDSEGLSADVEVKPPMSDNDAEPPLLDDDAYPRPPNDDAEPPLLDEEAISSLTVDDSGPPLHDDVPESPESDEDPEPPQFGDDCTPPQSDSEPSLYDDVAEPAQYSDDSEPPPTDDDESPLSDEDTDQSFSPDDAEPTQSDNDSERLPADVEVKPPMSDNNAEPPLLDDDAHPHPPNDDAETPLFDEEAISSLTVDDSEPPLHDDVPESPESDEDPEPPQSGDDCTPPQSDSEPSLYDDVAEPAQYSDDSEPPPTDDDESPLSDEDTDQSFSPDDAEPTQSDNDSERLPADVEVKPPMSDNNAEPPLLDYDAHLHPPNDDAETPLFDEEAISSLTVDDSEPPLHDDVPESPESEEDPEPSQSGDDCTPPQSDSEPSLYDDVAEPAQYSDDSEPPPTDDDESSVSDEDTDRSFSPDDAEATQSDNDSERLSDGEAEHPLSRSGSEPSLADEEGDPHLSEDHAEPPQSNNDTEHHQSDDDDDERPLSQYDSEPSLPDEDAHVSDDQSEPPLSGDDSDSHWTDYDGDESPQSDDDAEPSQC